MVKCCVEGCRNNSKFSSSDITYHRLPDARCFPNLYKKWLHKITGAPEYEMIDFIAQGTSRVCSVHFTEDDFVVKTDRNRTRRTLRVEALPTLRLPLFCQALKAHEADSYPIRFSDLVSRNLRMGSPLCINNLDSHNNNEPSSPSKCAMLDVMGLRSNSQDLEVQKTAKRIKVEPGVLHSRSPHIQTNYHPKDCDPSQHNSFQSPVRDMCEELNADAHIPACYRGKKNVYSPYAFSITELESELGFSVFMINGNKYLKCDPVQEDCQIWRCIIKNCWARAATASAHCSILIGLRGVHYHLPTKNVALDPADWAPGTPATVAPWGMSADDDTHQSDTTSWSPDVGRDSGCEQSPVAGEMSPWGKQQCTQSTSPPQLHSDSRFGVRDLLAPNSSQFQLSGSQEPLAIPYQALSSLDALSKFCGAQVTQGSSFNKSRTPGEPFNGSRSSGEDGSPDHTNVVPATFQRMEDADVSGESHLIIADPRSMSTDEQTEYILPSPASEQNKGVNDETSEGSSSDRMSTQVDETSFYELVDVGDVEDVIQEDPLAPNENRHTPPDNNQTSTSLRTSLKEEDAAFFESLGPHLNLFSAQEKQIFRNKVIALISHMSKKVTSGYNDSVTM